MASKNGSVANALRDKAGTKSWERGGIRFCFSRRCSSAVVAITAAVPLGVGDGANFPIARFAVLIFIIMNFGAVSTTAVQSPHWLTFGNRHNTLQLSAGWRSSLLSLLNNQQELLACLLACHASRWSYRVLSNHLISVYSKFHRSLSKKNSSPVLSAKAGELLLSACARLTHACRSRLRFHTYYI